MEISRDVVVVVVFVVCFVWHTLQRRGLEVHQYIVLSVSIPEMREHEQT